MRFTKLLRATASAAVLTAVAAGAAQAQEVTSVDEIIVTAQKREQSLQDVPIVVTTLSQAQLENSGVSDIKDMQILTPGLTVTSTTNESSTTARIRGVGTVGDNPGLESSVGVVIDGVYRPRNGVSFGDLGELQRIEILKGPQGTLFGKNTSAGVINIITEAPSFDYGVELEATAGNYGALGASASVTGAIVDDVLAGRLYVARRSRDGFYDVDTGDGPRTLEEDQDQDFWTARGQLLFQPSDNFDLRFIADYTKREENCCAAVQISTPSTPGSTAGFIDLLADGDGIANPADPFDRVAYSNRDTDQDIEDKGVSVEANLDLEELGGATLTSITAMREWEIQNGADLDFSGADISYRDNDGNNGVKFDFFSQELRLAGSTDRFDWLVGAFFNTEDLVRRDTFIYGEDYQSFLSYRLTAGLAPFGVTPNPNRFQCFTGAGFNPLCLFGAPGPVGPGYAAGDGIQDVYSQTSETTAFFTNNSYRFTDALELTVGLRYTMDEKAVTSIFNNTGTNGAACAGAIGNQANIVAGLVGVGATVPQATSVVQSVVGLGCLPWANPFFDGLITRQSFEDENLSGTVKLAWKATDDVMVYGSYARGYKAGGFNLDRIQSSNGTPSGGAGVIPVADTFFPAETVDSYELGVKTTWFGNSLLLNATAFYQEFEDFQLNAFLGTSFTVESIPGVTSKGVDADFVWFSPVEGLSFSGGVTYSDTQIDNFTAADLTRPSNFAALAFLPGEQLAFAPEWSTSLSGTYDRDIGDNLRMLLSLSAKWMSEYNTKSDLLPLGMQDSYALLNGRIGFGAADETWTIEVWGNNLTDEEYYQVVFNAPLQGTFTGNPATDSGTYNAFLGAPRTVGVTLRLKY
ncbi:MAG TPA: TonB-dependent receptor [Caulobacteraceae bacterium]|nr:TonB-dependent receptor [Caulobacteraceae bacterium]